MKNAFYLMAYVLMTVGFAQCGSKDLYAQTSAETIITINVDQSKDGSYDCAFMFDTTQCEIIPIETSDECLIGEVSKVFFKNDRIYILDKDANGVFILHEDGTLDRSIFAEGRSNREYMELGDMYVTDKLIYLFDNILMKILCFDLDGQYQKTIDISPYWANRILVQNNNIYLINEWSETEKGQYLLFVLDGDGKLLGKFLPFEETERYGGKDMESYTVLGDEVLLCYPSDNTVYRVADGACTPKYRIDFGDNALPKEYLTKSLIDCMKEGLADRYVLGIDAFMASSRYLLFRFDLGKTEYTAIYDKKTREVTLISSGGLINHSTCNLGLSQYFVDGDNVCSYYSALSIKTIYPYMKKLPEGNKYGEQLSKIVAAMDESDNGILIKYKLKGM